jgi:sodium-independent sulfate anion transporter 11
VVIPQGMAYALLAQLPAEYGLYTSFVGFILYWAFATSKDITIGTVAVMSTIVGNIVVKVRKEHPEMTAPDIARALSVIAGAVLLFIGLTRLGRIVELIPLVAITSFMKFQHSWVSPVSPPEARPTSSSSTLLGAFPGRSWMRLWA